MLIVPSISVLQCHRGHWVIGSGFSGMLILKHELSSSENKLITREDRLYISYDCAPGDFCDPARQEKSLSPCS